MTLIIFAGLPGTGKSTIAEEIGLRLGIPVFAKDWLEATINRCELQPKSENSPTLGYVGYELLTVLAIRQLRLGQSAILDSVASSAGIHQEWRDIAVQYGTEYSVIECICSDEEVHRQRLSGRNRGIPGWYELNWSEVERVREHYVPWEDERLVIDALDSFEANCSKVFTYLQLHS